MDGFEHRRWFDQLLKRDPQLQNVSAEDRERIKTARYEDDEDEDDEENTNFTLLHHAAGISNPTVVRKLINEFGMDPNAKSSMGDHPLAVALISTGNPVRQLQTVEVLLQAGADVNSLDGGLQTPLQQAIIERSERLVDTLLAHGADPNIRDQWQKTAIFYATTVPIVDKLLAAGADVTVKDMSGQTLIFNAVLDRSLDAVALIKKFIEAGVDWSAVNNEGRTAELVARSQGNTKAHTYLAKLREDKEAKEKKQRAVEVRGATEVAVRKGIPSAALKTMNEYIVGSPVHLPAASLNIRAKNAEKIRAESAMKREAEGSAEAVAAMKAGRKSRSRKTKRRKTLRRK